MDATTLVSVEQYLSSVYEPDCDYVDGEIEDRNVGEKDHSKLQFKVQMLLSRVAGISIFPEVRIRVAPTRYRAPDVAVYLTEPSEQVFTTPPFLVVEILSPEDRWSRLTRKLEDYFAMGCPNIWILDPVQSKAYRYEGEAVCEVHNAFRSTDSRIILQLPDIWPWSITNHVSGGRGGLSSLWINRQGAYN